MKKIVFGLAIASLVMSCKKIQAGGNKSILKQEEGVERYSDDHQGGEHAASAEGHGAEGSSNGTTSSEISIDLEGETLKAAANGLEDKMVKYLHSGSYASATEESLKAVWYDFDHVNFKIGSSNVLEAGSEEQLENLAKILKKYPEAKIKIGGNTDKTGDEAKNKALSTERAVFIKNKLAALGVGAQVISAEGYGSQFAKVDASASNEERAKDRKMSVRFTK